MESCEFCGKEFKKVLVKRHHCRMCARSMCSECTTKRRLSKTDATCHQICFECDFDLVNANQMDYFRQACEERDELIGQMVGHVKVADHQVKEVTKRKD